MVQTADILSVPEGQQRVADYLLRFRHDPPQVVLFEGGHDREREALALYWAGLLNCGDAVCGVCEVCSNIREKAFRDLIFLDGREESIKIDKVRDVRRIVGEPPRGDGMRVIVLMEAQELTLEAANCLLKSMEEPRPGNVFVLTAPQRERLLPTLVSRSWVLTLGWPSRPQMHGEDEEDPREWADAMHAFWASGREWFPRSHAHGRMKRALAELVVGSLQRDLTDLMAGRTGHGELFGGRDLSAVQLRRLDVLLEEARNALSYTVNPSLVLDWVALTARRLLS